MASPNPKRQKRARQVLKELFNNPENVRVIHYSCESFYDRKESDSPRITSIALRNLDSSQTRSFSIHQAAEVEGVPLCRIEGKYDKLERDMLGRFFSHIAKFQNMRYLHWNMRDANYGFQAIEHRYRALCGEGANLHEVDDRDKIDLPRLLYDIYGSDYIGHPRLEKLVTNDGTECPPPHFLTGEQEAKAFEDHNFVALHQSTLKKVDVISTIATLANDRKLKTNTTWWQMRGGHIVAFANWLGMQPIFALAIGGFSIIGALGVLTGLAAFLFRLLP